MRQEERPTVQANQSGNGFAGDVSVSPSQPTQALNDYASQPESAPGQQTIALGKPTPAMAWLAIVSGTRAGRLCELDPNGTMVGRDAQNDIVLDDTAVSRQHAKLRKEPAGGRKTVEKFYLYDLGSANGTHVNGRKVVRAALSDGDRIRIGETELVFKTVEPEAKPKPKAKKPVKRARKTGSPKE